MQELCAIGYAGWIPFLQVSGCLFLPATIMSRFEKFMHEGIHRHGSFGLDFTIDGRDACFCLTTVLPGLAQKGDVWLTLVSNLRLWESCIFDLTDVSDVTVVASLACACNLRSACESELRGGAPRC